MKNRIFYGWIIVLAIFLMLAVGWGIPINTNSIFITPIEEDLNFTRSQMLNALTIRSIIMAVTSLSAAWVFSKFNLKRIMEISAIVLCMAYFAMRFMTSIIHYYILISIQAACITYGGFFPASVIINKWFVKKNATALGIAFMGTGIGGMIFNLMGSSLILQIGWRATITVFTAIIFIIKLVTVFILIKVDPEEKGLKPYGNTQRETMDKLEDDELPKTSIKDVLKSLKFWMLGIGIMIMGMNMTGLVSNIAPRLRDIGYSLSTSGKVTSLSMISLAVGKLLLGVIFDRYSMRNATLLSSLSLLLGMLGMLFAKYKIALICIGLGSGFGTSFGSIAPPLYAEKLYPRLEYTSKLAFFQTMSKIGGIISPILMGAMYKVSNSYNSSLVLLSGSLIVASLIWLGTLPANNEKE
ncbi:MAG TPA: MFS transporter [Tepidimicrobium sp.]|nr:MFS transporter [Tepidimicrobium sp.]